MTTSKRAQEGYLLIDNRDSPGISPAQAHAAGYPDGAHQGLFEAPTITCSHCHRIVILNPLRTRDRAWCAKCDHYLCDTCGGVYAQTAGECQPLTKIMDQAQNEAARSQEPDAVTPTTAAARVSPASPSLDSSESPTPLILLP